MHKLVVSAIAATGLFSAVLIGCNAAASTPGSVAAVEPTPAAVATVNKAFQFTDGEFDGKEIVKSDEEWRAELTPVEYHIVREEGTERAFTGPLNKNHRHGTYYCAACGMALFSSDAKFESGTGWPSFFQPMFKKNVVEKEDRSLGDVRIEVECARCHAHLGHVFDDGPKPTGLRYCMNSASLKFKETK